MLLAMNFCVQCLQLRLLAMMLNPCVAQIIISEALTSYSVSVNNLNIKSILPSDVKMIAQESKKHPAKGNFAVVNFNRL